MSNFYQKDYFSARAVNRNFMAYENDAKFINDSIDSSGSILDYGCGEMLFTKYLEQCYSDVYVFDPSFAIKSMNDYGNRFKEDPGDFKYDAICLRGVLQHLPTPFFTVSKLIDKKLKKNGYLIFLATPNMISPYYLINRTLPALVTELNFWVPSTNELEKVMSNYNMKHVNTTYPYLNSGYARPVNDHIRFLINLFGIKTKYPFWFSMFNSIYQKEY
mgnify:CR=1 FL=1